MVGMVFVVPGPQTGGDAILRADNQVSVFSL